MGERGLQHCWITAGLTLLLVSLKCVEGAHKIATHNYKHHEIVQPKVYSGAHLLKDTLNQIGEHHHFITVTFTAFQQNFHLDLSLNRDLLPDSYVERYFDKGGNIVVTKPHISKQKRTHCFYHGSLKFSPKSTVALSTCSGVSGFFQDSKETYYIEALGHNITGHHVIYRESDRRPKNLTCGHKHDEEVNSTVLKDAEDISDMHHRSKRSVRGPYDRTSKTRVMELFVTNDHRQYLKYGRDIEKVIHRTKAIVNIVNSLYHPLDIRVALLGVEVWKDRDQVLIRDDADDTMNNYLEYRKTDINPHFWNDNAQLITGHAFTDGVVGKAVKGVMCTYLYSGGVSMDHTDEVGPVATTMAHEIGHNFGMEHDTGTCQCEDPRCIMAATSGGPNPTRWSSCSRQYLRDAFDQGLDYCLLNQPQKTYEGGVCGNSFLEDGEECDCGLPEDCTSRCCDPTTCRLFTNATCATGQCCDQDTCQLKPATTMCRSVSDEQCDLPEYCTGQSEWCPDDVYMQFGKECQASGMQAYCYLGKCHSHASQCRLLWGSTGQNAVEQCYRHLNRLGMAAGNCDYNWMTNKFKACEEEDLLCGLLQCDHANEKLMFWKEALSLTIPENHIKVNGTRYECKGAILDVGLNSRDPGMVPDGAKCGNNKMCFYHQCRPIELLGFKTCKEDCGKFGVCNSNGNCHCDVGFNPPDCVNPGNGGSVDSGPVKILEANVALIIGICLLMLVITPLLATAAYLMYKNREKLKMYVSVPTHSKPPPPPVPKQRPICKAVPVRSPSNASTRPPPARNVNRMSSFRDMEISTPVFQSSTNQTPVAKFSDVNTADPLSRPASMVAPSAPTESTSNRPNSVVITQGVYKDGGENVVSLASLSEEMKHNRPPARPPHPRVWTTTSRGRNDDYISAPIPIQTRPLPAVPDDDEERYYNESSPQHRAESIYYNEDSEEDSNRTAACADVMVNVEDPPSYDDAMKKSKTPSETRQPYVNMQPHRKAPAAPSAAATSKNNSVPRQPSKVTKFGTNNKASVSDGKTGNGAISSTQNTKSKIASGQTNSNVRPTKVSSNPTRSTSNVSRTAAKFQKTSPDSAETSGDKKPFQSKKSSVAAAAAGSKASASGLKKTPGAASKKTSFSVPAVPPHKTKLTPSNPASDPCDAADNEAAVEDTVDAAVSVTRPVGIVAAMKQKFAETSDQEPAAGSSAVTRSKSSVTPGGRQTRPVARTQTSAAELGTKRVTAKPAMGADTKPAVGEKPKPPPLPANPPSLSRSVSSASDSNSRTDSDTGTNRRRSVARTKSSVGDRPKLPVPPKPPTTKRNSSVC